MAAAKFRIDIFSEAENLLGRRIKFLILKEVRGELDRLANGSGERAREARFAQGLLSKCEEVSASGEKGHAVDDRLITTARRLGAIVATNDVGLRKRLRDINVRTLYVRGKSRLELEGIDPAYL